MTGQPLDLAGWLDRLGFTDGEFVQLGSKLGGAAFTAHCIAAGETNDPPTNRDVWVGPNPVEMVTTGRPTADQVTRLAALHIDLDVKPNGCPSFDIARAIVDDLSAMLGTRPVAITYSGHGLQPVWAVEEASIRTTYNQGEPGYYGPLDRSEARALLRRWGRLVANVAEKRGAKVDSLYDLTRLLRCPGSINHKYADNPIPVHTFADTGSLLSVEGILETLDAYGIHETGSDTRDPGAVVSAPAEWEWADTTCGYAATMAKQWATDTPDARHPWLLQQAVRVAAAHRYGCFDTLGREAAAAQLVNRFYQLLARDGRDPAPGEISDAFGWGMAAVAAMSTEHLASELGYHNHGEPAERLETTSNDPFGLAAGPMGKNTPSSPAAPAATGPADQPVTELHQGVAGPSAPAQPDQAQKEGAAPSEHALAARQLEPLVQRADLTPAERAELDAIKALVDIKARDLRILDEAKQAEQVRKAGGITIPKLTGLRDFLSVPPRERHYRIDGLLPLGARVVLAAQFKAGKTTVVGNLIRALADGDDLFGAFNVTPAAGSIVLLDNELDEDMLREWLRDQGVEDLDRVHILSLRGRVGTFDIINPTIRKEWADNLKAVNCGVLIFDCLRPVLDALGLSEDKESGQFLVAFDALLAEAAIGEAAVVHHMGHGGERSRGDSRLRDWPDVEWRLIRDVAQGEEDPAAPRYFSAFGRDVSIPEGALSFDRATRRLEYTEQSRKEARTEKAAVGALPAVLSLLKMSQGELSLNEIKRRVGGEGLSKDAVGAAVKQGIAAGSIVVRIDGQRHFHTLNPSARTDLPTGLDRSDRFGDMSDSPIGRPVQIGTSSRSTGPLGPDRFGSVNQTGQSVEDPFGLNELFRLEGVS